MGSLSAGILQDEQVRRANEAAGHALCGHCNGTGNELYAMYRACPECGGSGVAARHGERCALARWLILWRERKARERALRKRRRVELDWRHPRVALAMALGFGPDADGQAQWEVVSRIRWAASHYLCIGSWFWNGKDDCHRCGAQPVDVDFCMRRVGFRRAECIDHEMCSEAVAEATQ